MLNPLILIVWTPRHMMIYLFNIILQRNFNLVSRGYIQQITSGENPAGAVLSGCTWIFHVSKARRRDWKPNVIQRERIHHLEFE